MDRTLLGHVLLLAAALAWVAYGLLDGASALVTDLILGAGGFGLAAWASRAGRPRVVAVGLLLAAASIVLFYDGDFLGGFPRAAGALFAAGLVIAAASTFLDARKAVAAGMWVSAAGAAVWVWRDGFANFGWQPGNLLALAGAALVATARE